MLDAKRTAMLVIDVQEKLFRLMHEKDALEDNLVRAVQGAQAFGMPVVWAEQYAKGMGPTIPALKALLAPKLSPIDKKTFSCWAHDDIRAAMQATGKDQWLLVGIETHVCVTQTALDLRNEGMEVHVLSDAAGSRNPANKEVGLRRMAAAGVQISSVEMALFELLGQAEGEVFKQVSRIVK